MQGYSLMTNDDQDTESFLGKHYKRDWSGLSIEMNVLYAEHILEYGTHSFISKFIKL